MKRLLTLLAIAAFFSTGSLLAQTKAVTGKVSDERGVGIPNASIIVKGTEMVVSTNKDGTFSTNIPETAKLLLISAEGMKKKELRIGNQTNFSVVLISEDKDLQEVVVVGYGAQRSRDITASIASVTASKIKDIPSQSFEQTLAGKATGLSVVLPNAVLNNTPVVRIRGINSITGFTFPLVIVDGFPVNIGESSNNLSANNALGNINPYDIENIQILKDAAATAIYGSRATNGVLLVTTKRGKPGKTKVNYDVSVGWSSPFRLFNVLNAQEYVSIKNEAIKNGNNGPVLGNPSAPAFFLDTVNGKLVDTRWKDYIYQTGFQQNHTLSISGANQNTKYYFSANYSKQEGILQTNVFDRIQTRINIDQRVNGFLKVGGNVNFSRVTTQSPNSGSLPGTAYLLAGAARLAFITAPNVSPYTADGRYNILGVDNPVIRNNINRIAQNKNLARSGFFNPVPLRDLNKTSSQNDQLIASLNAEVSLFKGLIYKTQYGVNYATIDDRTFWNGLHGDGIQTQSTTDDGTAFNSNGKTNTTVWQNTLNYDVSVANKHNFNILAGHEEIANKIDRWGAKRSGATDDFYNVFQGNFILNDPAGPNVLSENYLLSFFGRLNYNFNNRYYISGNVRRDGYSAFAEGKKWGTFAGGSMGWNISQESFWENGRISNIINGFKLKGSYGRVGNILNVADYESLSGFSSYQYGNGYPTLFFSQAGNRELRWESSTQSSIGIQFGMFNNRITGDVSYYNTQLKDLIIDVPVPSSMGIPNGSISANAAEMFNKGIEVSLTGVVVEKNGFSWNTTINVSTQKNGVIKLANGVPEIVGTTSGIERANITRPGHPVGSFFLVKTAGVDPATGKRIFINSGGKEVLFDFSAPFEERYRFRDGSIAPAITLAKDGYIAGSALPTVYGGLSNSFTCKQFDLLVDAIFSYGNKIYFGSRAGLLDQRFWNNSKEVLNRWKKPGDVTNVPKVVYNDNISNGSAIPIDANLFNGGFVKIRSISLGYTLPTKMVERAKLSSLRLYANVFNAFLFTKYPGSDPEISANGNAPITPGMDRNTIGQARTFSVGLNVGF